MTSNIHTLRGADLTSPRRAELLNDVAAAFDEYVREYDVEPDAVVGVFGGLKQDGRCFYSVRGDSEGGTTAMLAFAQAWLLKEIVCPDGEDGE